MLSRLSVASQSALLSFSQITDQLLRRGEKLRFDSKGVRGSGESIASTSGMRAYFWVAMACWTSLGAVSSPRITGKRFSANFHSDQLLGDRGRATSASNRETFSAVLVRSKAT